MPFSQLPDAFTGIANTPGFEVPPALSNQCEILGQFPLADLIDERPHRIVGFRAQHHRRRAAIRGHEQWPTRLLNPLKILAQTGTEFGQRYDVLGEHQAALDLVVYRIMYCILYLN
ncbi:hypothetical protein [Gemmatimonas aurantiaca]|uniref:hypothetical protein n=1 Tax=Gemmatimonas aurantiaca TaxID=173480 RepID=UPI00301C4215